MSQSLQYSFLLVFYRYNYKFHMCFLDKLYRNIWLKIFCAMNIIVPYILMTSTFTRIFCYVKESRKQVYNRIVKKPNLYRHLFLIRVCTKIIVSRPNDISHSYMRGKFRVSRVIMQRNEIFGCVHADSTSA